MSKLFGVGFCPSDGAYSFNMLPAFMLSLTRPGFVSTLDTQRWNIHLIWSHFSMSLDIKCSSFWSWNLKTLKRESPAGKHCEQKDQNFLCLSVFPFIRRFFNQPEGCGWRCPFVSGNPSLILIELIRGGD